VAPTDHVRHRANSTSTRAGLRRNLGRVAFKMFRTPPKFLLGWFRCSEIFLNGNKGALEEGVIYHIRLAAFSANNPFPAFYIDNAKVGGDRLRLSTLHSVHDHWSRSAINAHNDFGPLLWPTVIYLTVPSIKYVEGICKGIIGLFGEIGPPSECFIFIVPSTKRIGRE